MQYKHIIFDIDGTLIDTEVAVLSSLKETIKEYFDSDIELEELYFALGIPGDTALQKLNIENIQEVKATWSKKFKNYYSTVRLFPQIEELLFEVKQQGLKIGIITSKTRKEYQDDFTPFNLDGIIDISLCIDDYKSPKPSSEGMYLYLTKAGIKPQEAIYIGDTIYDYQCANGAGVDFGLAKWGCKNFEGISAKYTFIAPPDIKNVISVSSSP